MKSLLILLSVMMTFTVKDKHSVTADLGTWPDEVSASYSCTYQKGDVRAGDTAVLALTGLAHAQVEKIDLYLRSNKDKGAGIITITADGAELWRKEGTYKDWFGAYNNATYEPVGWSGVTRLTDGTLEVMIIGTVNSLHIEKYEITCSQIADPVHSVTLMDGTAVYATLTEQTGGQGVSLPWLDDRDGWTFAGWSETEFGQTETLPAPLISSGTYHPTEDGTLWAVYEQDMTPPVSYVTELYSDVFLYLDTESHMALTGVPHDGRMDIASANVYDEQQHYRIDFVDAQTATITHEATQTPIGYSGTGLAAKSSLWSVYHDGEQTLFYTTVNGKNYILWLTVLDNDYVVHAGLLQTDPMPSPLSLQSTLMSERWIVYTCHPETQGVEQPMSDGKEYIFYFGNYELRIKDGRKYLKLR